MAQILSRDRLCGQRSPHVLTVQLTPTGPLVALLLSPQARLSQRLGELRFKDVL